MKSIQRAIAARHEAIKNDEAKGFTLIELLVVVIIIGILAAIAIPVFLSQREAAWKASVESDLKNVSLAIETYSVTHNGSLTGLATTSITHAGGNATLPNVFASPDNTITIAVAGNAYTLTGINANIVSTWNPLTYSSAAGGIQGWTAKVG